MRIKNNNVSKDKKVTCCINSQSSNRNTRIIPRFTTTVTVQTKWHTSMLIRPHLVENCALQPPNNSLKTPIFTKQHIIPSLRSARSAHYQVNPSSDKFAPRAPTCVSRACPDISEAAPLIQAPLTPSFSTPGFPLRTYVTPACLNLDLKIA